MAASGVLSPSLTATSNCTGLEQHSSIEQVAAALRARGRLCLTVLGSSMFPWLRPGDILWVCCTSFDRLSPGMVVLFAREGKLIVHRVIRKQATASGPALLTKGDCVPHTDAPVLPQEILGRVVWIQRGRRQIDLDSSPQRFRGLLLARVSPFARFWFPAARKAKRLLIAAGMTPQV
jgi:signal peptidase